MAKYVLPAVLDVMLEEIAEATTLVVCSTQPTTRTEAVTTYALADVAVTPGSGNGDFTLANGDTSGRKLTIGIQSDIPVDTTGTAAHIALVDGTRLLYVTTCTSQAVTSGNTVTVPAWDIEVANPA